MAMNAEQGEEVMKLVQNSGALFMEALMYRHHPQIAEAKRLIEQGEIGEIGYIHAIFTSPVNSDPNNWRNHRQLGGGTMAAKGCYLVDALNWFAGAPVKEVFCRESRHAEFDVENGQTGTIVYSNGVIGQFETNHRTSWREEILIQGTKGAIRLPHAIVTKTQPRTLELQIGGSFEAAPRKITTIEFDAVNSYQLEYKNMYDCLFQGGRLRLPVEQSVYNLKVIDMLAQSVRTHQVVSEDTVREGENERCSLQANRTS
jgi:predicted dehydrogenase